MLQHVLTRIIAFKQICCIIRKKINLPLSPKTRHVPIVSTYSPTCKDKYRLPTITSLRWSSIVYKIEEEVKNKLKGAYSSQQGRYDNICSIIDQKSWIKQISPDM